MKSVTYTTTALKQLAGMPRVEAQRLRAKVAQYAADSASLANQVKRLEGAPYLRLRVGDYRVIISEDGTVVQVVRVGHRNEVYRGLPG